MARTENLRKQHAEILQLAREINARLSAQLDAADAAAIRPLLAKLAGLVSLHLAIEDRSLYPALAAHSDPEARMLSKRYMDEMAGIAAAFNDYVRNWQATAKMLADPAAFTSASKAVFNTLSKRIHYEHTELYPLLDALAG